MCRPDKKPHPYLPHNFFQEYSSKPEPVTQAPDSPLFTPIFPRRVSRCPADQALAIGRSESRRKNVIAGMATKLDSVSDLPAFIGAEPTNAFETADEKLLGPEGKQLYEENMVIVDGWRMSLVFSLS
jgi:hypothetical protein